MSISKAQAAAIADGFLDQIGSGDSKTLRPANTYSEIILIAGEMAEEMVNNLNQQKKIATGNLAKSIVANEPVRNGSVLKVDVEMNFYGKFVNAGVKGLSGGSSKANYSFRTEKPSEGMVKAISDWIKQGKAKVSNVIKYKNHGRSEAKNRSINQLNLSSAYAIGISIKRKGLKPTGFLDKAIVSTHDKVKDRLGSALEVDIINAIT